ncbi:hypothetical protein I4U23_001963 [Adineta vaga]|nr:hypothetical protein I4U23_001963 [Adineta vaga]
MYKVIRSFWSKPASPNRQQSSANSQNDEDGWVVVSDAVMITPSMKTNSIMTNSWIATPPLVKNDESSMNVHHFNPIENLLIEHASMSVYEQIASKTRIRRQKGAINNDNKVDEEDDDEDDPTSVDYQNSNGTSMFNQNLNGSTHSSVTNLDSSLIVHQRYLNRLHQRRKRSNKPSPSSKLISTTNIDDSKQLTNKAIERQRLNHTRTPKIPIQQTSRLIH